MLPRTWFGIKMSTEVLKCNSLFRHISTSKRLKGLGYLQIKMPKNVEIKACVHDMEKLKSIAAELSQTSGTLIIQEDTFFNVPNGRLKLRELKGSPSQLIFYARPDADGPKLSEYHVTLIENPDDAKVTLGKALGVKGCVKKNRMLYLVGQTRVHVDQVEGLGDFMELEVVMEDSQTVEEGQKIANELMEKLSIKEGDLLTGAYMDMILKKSGDLAA